MNSIFHKRLEKLLENTGDMALKRRARRIIEEIDPRQGDRILEIGCGDGFYLHLLSNLGINNLEIVGCDIDSNALASARKNLKGKNIRLIKNDLMKGLPFKNNFFDKIIMSEVLEHLPDDLKGLREAKRVLKRGGKLVVSVPNHNYPFLWDPVNWIIENFFGTHIKKGFWAGIWNQHLRLYKPKEIKIIIEKAGFEIKNIESLTFWCLPFNHNLIYLAARQLYGNKLSKNLTQSISKYQISEVKKSLVISFAFWIINLIDKLNDIYTPKRNGVGILIES